eukprot:7397751-Pyramimonas_sp.AAC.1
MAFKAPLKAGPLPAECAAMTESKKTKRKQVTHPDTEAPVKVAKTRIVGKQTVNCTAKLPCAAATLAKDWA